MKKDGTDTTGVYQMNANLSGDGDLDYDCYLRKSHIPNDACFVTVSLGSAFSIGSSSRVCRYSDFKVEVYNAITD